ncbi:DNA/RNA non-specific endonuclease [Mesorhizobium sp. Z1-4]|uniref:DNA/RNA non-specific endonuclease n=1 Tax=Mesorhizobium sp. Z1-4 TaxID=2448478 RepID=UPI0013DF3699|nr:DNA/RNA non-specific endonuclease [Mesorhizobium sp. Z1-4]
MVDVRSLAEVELRARERLRRNKSQIEYSLEQIADGNPLAAETQPFRRLERIQTKAGVTRDEAEMMSVAIEATARQPRARGAKRAKAGGPEVIRGATLDFVGVAFLEIGRRAADAVGRIAFLNDAPQGTGFLVGPRLLLTNHHVIETAAAARRMQVQFDYEYGVDRFALAPSNFFLDPGYCFVTDGIDGLDFTLIGIGAQRSGTRQLAEFGYLPLSDAGDKHMLGETANVIQHPDGRYKELVLRENHLVARDETAQVLHYVADTEQGSSGSPVFNNEWEPIALHHWGTAWREVMGTDGRPLSREVNEGIRISAIVTHLQKLLTTGGIEKPAVVRAALEMWERARDGGRSMRTPIGAGSDVSGEESRNGPAGSLQSRVGDDGSVTWTFPIEITVRAPLAAATPDTAAEMPAEPEAEAPAESPGGAERRTWRTEEFDDRGGYEPGFIPGFIVPLPTVAKSPYRIAENQLAGPGDDKHELPYHHFSIVMNADRRLAFFTAVNIDGKRIKAVKRGTKTVTSDPSLSQLGVERIAAEGAEASDDFRPDRRVLESERMDRPFYEKQVVPGFPDPSARDRIARMFQKGHIVLRGDPAWGSDEEALAAERDTFFYTNAAPQVGFFNQGSDLDRPGSKGKLRWRAVETYVLRNAVTMKSRISVFAGPIFAKDDPEYRFGAQVPMRFWKIAVWNDGGTLRSIALIADQRPVLKVMPERIADGAEAFGDDEELARVSEFLATVAEVEKATGLDFGDIVRDGDIRAGAESAAAVTLKATDLKRRARKPAKKSTAASRRKPARRKS